MYYCALGAYHIVSQARKLLDATPEQVARLFQALEQSGPVGDPALGEVCYGCNLRFQTSSAVIECIECESSVLLCEQCGIQTLPPANLMLGGWGTNLVMKCETYHQKQRFENMKERDIFRANAAFDQLQEGGIVNMLGLFPVLRGV